METNLGTVHGIDNLMLKGKSQDLLDPPMQGFQAFETNTLQRLKEIKYSRILLEIIYCSFKK